MVDVRELRFGNVVWDDVCNELHGNPYVCITELKTSVCHWSSFVKGKAGRMMSGAKYEDLTPIPLTPDILLKCGFVNRGFDYSINDIELTWKEKGGVMLMYGVGYDSEWESVPNCNSLHQLQNLYYSLTGNELEIKL